MFGDHDQDRAHDALQGADELTKEVVRVLLELFTLMTEQRESLLHLHRKVDLLMTQSNASQADIDALTQSVTDDRTAIATVVAQLNNLIAAGQPVQVGDLQAAVAGLTSDIAGDAPAPGTPTPPVDTPPPGDSVPTT